MNARVSSQLGHWFRSVVRRERFEGEMEEEMRFHLEARTEALRAQGVPVEEARRQARLEFGGLETHRDGMRSAFGLRWWDDLVADLRYSTRLLRQSPSFTLVAVASLALAIGANTTIFSLANEILFKRLGIPRASELRLLQLQALSPTPGRASWGNDIEENGVEQTNEFTYLAYQRLKAANHTLGPIVAFKDLWNANITAAGVAQAGDAQLVSGDFYNEMEVQPQLGRPIVASDDGAPGTGAVAMISDSFWHRAFGASPTVLGRSLNVNGAIVTIIGVNPRGFTGAQAAQVSPEVFLPMSMMPAVGPALGGKSGFFASDNFYWIDLMARARPGDSVPLAEANFNSVFHAVMQGVVKLKPGEHMYDVRLVDGSHGLAFFGDRYRKPVYVLLGLSGMVLLLACANLANLMLARATAREREMNVRLALGAGRERLIRQILTESLLLSVMGGGLGLLLSFFGRNVIPNLLQREWDITQLHVAFDWHVFLFTSLLTLLTGIVFGLLPAWRSSRGDLNAGLKEASRTGSRRRAAWTGKLIVAFQIMLSTLLVASSGLFLRTLINLNHVHTGFRTQGLLLFDLRLSPNRYPKSTSVSAMAELEEGLRSVPGVRSVTFAQPALLSGSNWSDDFDPEGEPKPKDEARSPMLGNVGDRFFSVLNIPILRGRSFGLEDTATSPRVAIINQSTAERYFPHKDPLGRRFRMSGDEGNRNLMYTIVGICGDTLYANVRDKMEPLHFELYRQNPSVWDGTMILDTTLPAAQLLPGLRQVVRRLDPDLPITNLRTQQQQVDADMQQERMFASLSAGFGLLALLLACVGVYGVMAYTVTQRTNEIGIRLALGAPRARVRAMVLREASLLAIGGVVVGLGVVVALVQVVKSLLYGLEPRDPVSLGVAGSLLLLVALVAGWVPAARASRVEPMEALRHE